MTTYILLRDNLESTPLSLAALKEIGLKESDLVWAEGQSVCWLSPGQIKELKDLVPGNRTNSASITAQLEDVPAEVPTLNVVSEPLDHKSSNDTRHIFVELPKVATKPQVVMPKQKVDELAFIPKLEPEFPKVESKCSTNHDFYIPPQLKRAAFYFILFITGLAAGLIINNALSKKQTIAQTDKSLIASTGVTGQATEIDDTVVNNSLLEPINDQTTETATIENSVKKVEPRSARLPASTESLPINSTVLPDPSPTDLIIPTDKTEEVKEIKKPSIKEIYSQVALKNNDYTVGSFGGIKNLELTLSNHSRYALDEVEVLVRYLKPDNELVKSETISFRTIPPGGTKTVPVKKTNRGVKVSYKVNVIKSSDFQETAGL